MCTDCGGSVIARENAVRLLFDAAGLEITKQKVIRAMLEVIDKIFVPSTHSFCISGSEEHIQSFIKATGIFGYLKILATASFEEDYEYTIIIRYMIFRIKRFLEAQYAEIVPA